MARTQRQLEQAVAEAEAWLDSLDPERGSADDIEDLRAIAAAVDAIAEDQARLTAAVGAARRNGRSWGMIARALGVSKQAAQQRFGEHVNTGSSPSGFTLPALAVRGRAQMGEHRHEGEAGSDRDPDFRELVDALAQITSSAQFEVLVDQRPALFGQGMRDFLQQLIHDPNIEPFVRRFQDLVQRANTEPSGAWASFQQEMDELEREARRFESILDQLKDLISHKAYEDAITLGNESLPRAREAGLGLVVGEIHSYLSEAFRHKMTGDPADNSDAAIDHADGALAAALDPAHRVARQMNLAVLLASRKNGDPAENFEQGIHVVRDALEQLDDEGPGDLRAAMQTNLANMLRDRQRGERFEDLREARNLCLAALEWRSLERNGEDWAYTKINLAAVSAELAGLEGTDPAYAESDLLEVIDAADEIRDPRLIGMAHGLLGRLNRQAAEKIAYDEDRTVIGPGKPPPPGDAETERLAAAQQHLDAALGLLDPETDRDEVGRVLNDRGALEEALGNDAEAIGTYQQALGALRPKSMPVECLQAGARLGELLAHRGDWDASAAAYKMAIDAGEFGFHARLESADRAVEIQRAGNLGRWAAFALAKTGDTDAAVLVLEASRTRELRRRLGLGADEALLDQLPDEARAAYREALEEISVASLGSDSDGAGRRLQRVLTAIRSLPGLSDFSKGLVWSDVVSAVEPDVPVVYVNPTPFGTLLLSIAHTDQGITSAAQFLDSPSAHDVLMALMFGDMSDAVQPSSYLAGASGANNDSDAFRRGLDYVLRALGEWVAHPVADGLRALGATGATIVACGPISQAPLHAATWSEGEGNVSLLDLFDIRFSPSATLQAACLRQARDRANTVHRLTALGNPDLGDPKDDLPAAEAEVSEIARHFVSSNRAIAIRRDATRTFLAANAPGATHLHLACHAQGGLLDFDQAGVDLTDGRVSAAELAALSLKARLTVVSACQTAIAEITRLPDEAFSLSTAFLAAGSASVVATLWSINDAVTALLMARFYEELFDGIPPTQALRSAQLWLRNLNEDDEAIFLAAHPELEDLFHRRTEEGQRPGWRSGSDPDAGTSELQPYSAPEFWAPFVAIGG